MNKQEQEQFSEKIRKRISRNMIALRERKGWTRYQMATKVGLTWRTLQRWELGYNVPTIDKLLWLCKCNGWKLSDLLGGGKTDE